MASIADRGVSAVRWSVASTLGRVSLQMVAQVFLARRLGPEIYGVFGIGLVVFAFSNFLATFGFGWALLQVDDVCEEDIRFAFTWQVVSGAAAGLTLFHFAPVLAVYFHEPRVAPVIRWLAMACVLNGAAGTASNLLLRDLNFRAIGFTDIASYALGYICVGIPLAWSGAGVTSLIAAWLVQACTRLIANFGMRPHSLRPLFWYRRAPQMCAIASTVFVTNLVNWVLANVDRLMIGRLLDAQAVGLYNGAYNLASAPSGLLLSAVQPALFSASARMQGDLQRLGKAYLHVVAAICVFVLPLFAFLSTMARPAVGMLYGARWDEAGKVLGILFLAMPLYLMWGLSTPVLWNTGRKHYEALLQLPLLFLGIGALYHFAPMGLHAAAVVVAILVSSRGVVIGAAAFHAAGLRRREVLPHLARGVVLSVVVCTGARMGMYFVSGFAAPIVALMAGGLGAILPVIGIVWWRPAMLGDHAFTVAARFVPRLRDRVRVTRADDVLFNARQQDE